MTSREPPFRLRDFRPTDVDAVNRVALAAFRQFSDAFADWPAVERNVRDTASPTPVGELIVATVGAEVAGAVTYVGPGLPKRDFFPVEWPIVRMLVVSPDHRGLGIGRALTEECVRRAERDGAPLIALHTSPVMTVALPMYERMGFHFHSEAPRLHGVPYGIYVKPLREPR
jgi:ribosomal protein S18 acetylase RimI-like enzyme